VSKPSEHDAIVVGARCAGSALAISLAKRDWDVLLVDRVEFPSDTISTNGIWPNGVARLEQLGILDTLLAEHDVPMTKQRIRGMGHVCEGAFTPIGGFDQAFAPRRLVLDKAGVDTALAAGAAPAFGRKVVGMIGEGTEGDRVRGVAFDDGGEARAPWVFGADGRGSTVAKALGLKKERPMRGEMAFAYGFWRGIPNDGYGGFHIELGRVLTTAPVEDGLHMLIVAGPPEIARGSKEDRRRTYLEYVHRFPETVSADVLARAELATDVFVAPESLLRGFYRQAAGPGWALVGDAGHFKHPGTAQGIGDAVEQAVWVADALSGAKPSLDGYEAWRDERAREHYDWSFVWGYFPRPENEAIFRGWAAEPDAGQDLRDSFSRLVEPSRVMSPERLARWFGTPTAGSDRDVARTTP
jgi:2-polyprenyl-6-methoxyphenol hydroxylase-like FAD-dependent oxidoreductase